MPHKADTTVICQCGGPTNLLTNPHTTTTFMPHKADTTVICQCGAMVCKYYMPKHLRTAKHERDMVGREHIEVVEHLRYIPRN